MPCPLGYYIREISGSTSAVENRIAIIIVILMALVFTPGCVEDKRNDGAFIIGLEGSPTNLDPRYSIDAYSSRIRPLIFDSLIEVAPNGDFIPGIAKSWNTKDGLTYTFYLRDDVRFHDGALLTSKDVKYTFEYLMNPENKCPSGPGLNEIEAMETPDDFTIVFHLKKVFVPVLFKLVKGIVPAHLGNNEDFGKMLIGTGPFRLTGLNTGEWISLLANEEYFKGAPFIKSLRFEVVRNDTTRMLRLQKGELNLIQNSSPPYAVKFLGNTEGLKVIRQAGVNYSYLGFNLKDPNEITSDKLVRKALAHAVDRQKIIDALMKGQAQIATGLLSPSNWAYNGAVPIYDYDPEKAKALLDQAGFTDPDQDGPGLRFTLSYKTSTNKLRNRIAEVMAVQLAQVGIGLEKRSYEWGTFFADIKKGNFQTYTLSWVGITDPDIFQYIFHSDSQPPKGANRGRYENPDVDALIEKSRIETDKETRKELLHKIQYILAEDCVYISLWWADNIVIANEKLKGFIVFPGGEFTSLARAKWK